ncbi:3-hydroxyisobutyryl-CoA hydrolase, mitochondrial [Trichoplax sp. H2]|nr:3-hydroxyisobutyryl-CoA hydrolase, mitochondrial [Trichoplax sp. H2]|eukprot:RDD41315.1 3-hydroxyisobutyryl-CoA hydrolase, mitochondrial [Trichoplax sp. H2]
MPETSIENRLKGKDVYFAAIATHYVRSQDIYELEEKFISQDNITDRINREILNQYHMKKMVQSGLKLPQTLSTPYHSENDGDQRFYEGAKAVLIDRDHNPKWDPATLEEVTDENINAQFKPKNRLKGKDVYFAAIATHYVRSQDIYELEEKFISQDNITDRINREILHQYHHSENDGDQRFYEGAKAVLIDRDHNPKWDPAMLEEVTDENINAQFKPSDDGDLILPRQQFL